jgi:hypothetical protein
MNIRPFLLCAALLLIPIAAMASTRSASDIRAGSYQGSITSVNPHLNDTSATLNLARDGENYVAKVRFADGTSEEWRWNDMSLTQKEFDRNARTTRQYTASAIEKNAGKERVYRVHCRNEAKNQCDAGIDARQYWVLIPAKDRLQYEAFGVNSEHRSDKQAKAVKRHSLAFRLQKTAGENNR